MPSDEPAYVCHDCGREWVAAEYDRGGALDAAINHPCDASTDPDVGFDPGYTADDYEVDFDSDTDTEEGSA